MLSTPRYAATNTVTQAIKEGKNIHCMCEGVRTLSLLCVCLLSLWWFVVDQVEEVEILKGVAYKLHDVWFKQDVLQI